MKFLYLEEDSNIRDLYAMKLEADFRAEIVEVSSELEAIKYITSLEKQDKLSSLDLILTDFDALKDGRSDLVNHCKKNSITTPFVAISTKPLKALPNLSDFLEYNQNNRVVKKPTQEKIFKDTIYEVLQAMGDKVKWKQLSDEGHIAVKIHNFLRFNKVPCDVFIRLNKTKFVKLINKDDMYTSEVVKKYQDKNIENLYVVDEDYPHLANVGMRTLLSLYDRAPKESTQLDLQLASLEEIHTAVSSLGVSKEVVELTKKTIESSVKLVKRVPTIAQLLNKMKTSGNYIYDHSLKVSFICTSIAKHTEWNSDSTSFKLSLAATMHDMTLEDPALAQIQLKGDERLKNYDEKLVEKYFMHPLEAAEMIKENKNFPPDIDFIVAQHHERPDGSGFPRGLSKLRISPLACLFILGHEVVSRIEEEGGEYNKENLGKIFQELDQEMYTQGNFKKPFKGLCEAFKLKTKHNLT